MCTFHISFCGLLNTVIIGVFSLLKFKLSDKLLELKILKSNYNYAINSESPM